MASRPPRRARADRHERAARALKSQTKHLIRRLDSASALVKDTREALSEALENGSYPADQWMADTLALSVNAWATLLCCFAPTTTPTGHITFEVPENGSEKTDEPQPETPRPEREPNIVFDVKSEMAGPVAFDFSEPVKLSSIPDLVGTGGTIRRDHVVVRVVVRGLRATVIVSLRDLRNVTPGTYEGDLRFTDSAGGTFTLPLQALCKNRLWWL